MAFSVRLSLLYLPIPGSNPRPAWEYPKVESARRAPSSCSWTELERPEGSQDSGGHHDTARVLSRCGARDLRGQSEVFNNFRDGVFGSSVRPIPMQINPIPERVVPGPVGVDGDVGRRSAGCTDNGLNRMTGPRRRKDPGVFARDYAYAARWRFRCHIFVAVPGESAGVTQGNWLLSTNDNGGRWQMRFHQGTPTGKAR